MEYSLINPAWHDRYLEQIEKTKLSEESVKELLNGRRGSVDEKDFITAGKTAIVPILGPLTKTKDFFFSLFSDNNTTYDSIIAGVQAADSDDEIENTELNIDSPGGNWIGLTEAVQAIAGAKKPITAKITGMATSAAYVLAAQADKIISSTIGNNIGGLGVVTHRFKFGEEKTVRSSNASKKNPDAFTAQGEKDLKKELDAIETQAIKMVSDGRSAATGGKITEKIVKKDFGRGASMLADEALSLNMIDEITPAPARISNAVPAATSGKGRKLESGRGSDVNLKNGKKIMDLAELRREYPELCAQLLEEGRTLERDQVKGHVLMAKNTGAVEFALECLDEGKSLQSQEVIAGYMSAGMKKTDLENREGDNPDGDLSGDGDTELNEDQKTTDLVEKSLKLSNKPVTVEA